MVDKHGNVSYREVFREYPDCYGVFAVTGRDDRGFANSFQIFASCEDIEEATGVVESLIADGEDASNIMIIPTKEAEPEKVVAFSEDENIKTALSPEDYARFVRVYLRTGAY